MWGSLTCFSTTSTTNPAVSSAAFASARDIPVTSGIFTLAGTPLLTWIVTSDPSSADAPPPGVCASTIPFGSAESTVSTSGVKFAPASLFCALTDLSPTTSGTEPYAGAGGAGKLSAGIPAITRNM